MVEDHLGVSVYEQRLEFIKKEMKTPRKNVIMYSGGTLLDKIRSLNCEL